MSLFPESRALIIGEPKSFRLLDELTLAKTIRLATAFAHKSGWNMLARSMGDSKANRYLLTGKSLFQTEPEVLWAWLELTKVTNVYAALYSERDITFHPKVLIVEGRRDFAIVGSGNLSRGGLQTNIECGVFVEPGSMLKELQAWFDTLFAASPLLNDSLVLDYEKKWKSIRSQVKELRKRQQQLDEQLSEKSGAIMKRWKEAVSAARLYRQSPEFLKAYAGRAEGGDRIKKFLHYATGFDFDAKEWKMFYSELALGRLIQVNRDRIFRKKDRLQAGLKRLVDQDSNVPTVLNEFLSRKGKFHISGFSLGAISKILAVHAPQRWAVYNNRVDSTLRQFGYLPTRRASPAEKFIAFTQMMDAFKAETGLQDAFALDAFLYRFSPSKMSQSDSD